MKKNHEACSYGQQEARSSLEKPEQGQGEGCTILFLTYHCIPPLQ
jgi:hypothetical protein